NADGKYELTGRDPRQTYTFAQPGTFPVKVRVADKDGGAIEQTLNVTVLPAPAGPGSQCTRAPRPHELRAPPPTPRPVRGLRRPRRRPGAPRVVYPFPAGIQNPPNRAYSPVRRCLRGQGPKSPTLSEYDHASADRRRPPEPGHRRLPPVRGRRHAAGPRRADHPAPAARRLTARLLRRPGPARSRGRPPGRSRGNLDVAPGRETRPRPRARARHRPVL